MRRNVLRIGSCSQQLRSPLDTGECAHRQGLADVLAVQFERDRAERLSAMIERGHYYSVFGSYWNGPKSYGLPSVA
jgi:hypothetical protein